MFRRKQLRSAVEPEIRGERQSDFHVAEAVSRRAPGGESLYRSRVRISRGDTAHGQARSPTMRAFVLRRRSIPRVSKAKAKFTPREPGRQRTRKSFLFRGSRLLSYTRGKMVGPCGLEPQTSTVSNYAARNTPNKLAPHCAAAGHLRGVRDVVHAPLCPAFYSLKRPRGRRGPLAHVP